MNPIKAFNDWAGTSKIKKSIGVFVLMAVSAGCLLLGRPEQAQTAYDAAKQVSTEVSSTAVVK